MVAAGGFADEPFLQEWHEAYPLASADANDVRSVAVDSAGVVWAATKAGVFMLEDGKWRGCDGGGSAGPAYKVAAGESGVVWAGTWDGLYRLGPAQQVHAGSLEGVEGPITAIAIVEGGVVALGPNGAWRVTGSGVTVEPMPCSRGRRDITRGGRRLSMLPRRWGCRMCAEARRGLYQKEDEILSPDVASLAFDGAGTLWAGGLGGVTLYRNGARVGQMTPAEGLPNLFVQCVRAGARRPDVGRHEAGRGAVRRAGVVGAAQPALAAVGRCAGRGVWSGRHGVRGHGGGSERHKAEADDACGEVGDYFESVTAARHKREPGFVEKVRLERPGDLNRGNPWTTTTTASTRRCILRRNVIGTRRRKTRRRVKAPWPRTTR